MTLINCVDCHEATEVPDELLGDAKPGEIEWRCGSCDPDDLDEDGYPDFTLDDLEWEEEYPELSDDLFCPRCGKEYEDFSDYGCPSCSPGATRG